MDIDEQMRHYFENRLRAYATLPAAAAADQDRMMVTSDSHPLRAERYGLTRVQLWDQQPGRSRLPPSPPYFIPPCSEAPQSLGEMLED